MVMKYIAALAIVLGMIAMPLARADTPDDQFMNAVGALGITGDRAALIADGHAACDTYGAGLSHLSVVYNLLGQGMSRAQVSGLELAAYRAYCPEKIAGSGL